MKGTLAHVQWRPISALVRTIDTVVDSEATRMRGPALYEVRWTFLRMM